MTKTVFQNETSQTGFQQQTRYFRMRPVEPVFINEQDLFDIAVFQFQFGKCLIK